MNPQDAALTADGINDLVICGQSSRVRLGDCETHSAGVGLVQDDGLGTSSRQVCKRAAPFETFQVEVYDGGFRVIHEIGQVVGFIEVQFIPHADKLAYASPEVQSLSTRQRPTPPL